MDCSLCCESFTEEGPHVPRNLDCGHTYCTICIQQLDSHAPLRQGPKCPECRAVIRLNRRNVYSLPKNYKLLELIREQRGQDKPETTQNQCTAASFPTVRPPPCPGERRQRGVMFMGSCFTPWMNVPNWISPIHVTPSLPIESLTDEYSRMTINRHASEAIEPQSHTTTTTPSLSPEAPQNPIPEAVANGRAVTGPNGTLVCKFFQEGTCRYGPHCWFSHPILNANKSLCRHWMKGQCHSGLNCHYRHGTNQRAPPIRPRQRRVRDPDAAGPSGEGVPSTHRPSVVVFVSSWGSTIHRSLPPFSARRSWGRFSNQDGASAPRLSSDPETFFDNFSTYPW